jgi:hypothetical protein
LGECRRGSSSHRCKNEYRNFPHWNVSRWKLIDNRTLRDRFIAGRRTNNPRSLEPNICSKSAVTQAKACVIKWATG